MNQKQPYNPTGHVPEILNLRFWPIPDNGPHYKCTHSLKG